MNQTPSSSIKPRQSLSLCCNALLLAACIAANSACTRPQKPTAIGSGVGGTVGAGLGAIIGSQSGNAGGGLAIGALAGAATGALVGNALQAQDEHNRVQDEKLKRQEQMLAAQKNEIAELRDIRSDLAYDRSRANLEERNPFENAPRYRYKSTSTDATSPAVERARNRLRQRGPNPRSESSVYGSSQGAIASDSSYTKTRTVQKRYTPPQNTRRSIARFDVRTELNNPPKKVPQAVTKTETIETKHQPSIPLTTKSEAKLPGTSKTRSNAIQERDIAINAPAKAVVSSASSPECVEALKERDRANTAQANSDKLYHLRRALRLCPNSAPLHYALGSVYASMDRRGDAENEYKEALRVDPGFSVAQKALGDILKEEIQF